MRFKKTRRLRVFVKYPNKKGFLKIVKEVVVLWIVKKEVPFYYFKHLYKKNVTNYLDFISTGEAAKIHKSQKLHKQEYTSILRNKLNFALYCERNGLESPNLVTHNFGQRFFFKNNNQEILKITDLIVFYRKVFDSIGSETIFLRPLSLQGGQGCFMINREQFPLQLENHYNCLVNGNYIHTEGITQHAGINAIYEKSVNTLRIMTIIDKGKTEILSSLIRIGSGGNIVDNTSLGGLSVGIDQGSGKLKRIGYRDMEFGGQELEKHPDTGFIFENFKIPYFEDACELVKSANRQIPNGFVGWDVAITTSGPTIIEGNENASIFFADVAYGGLLQNPNMIKLLAQIR